MNSTIVPTGLAYAHACVMRPDFAPVAAVLGRFNAGSMVMPTSPAPGENTFTTTHPWTDHTGEGRRALGNETNKPNSGGGEAQ
jgi:hypothetical protein